jgi:alkanesulfonate monooxygenase SsuD/methylene tetrahydromethanopterin reductase-like flavin-dependent oxidoreductase (luciferase family)
VADVEAPPDHPGHVFVRHGDFELVDADFEARAAVFEATMARLVDIGGDESDPLRGDAAVADLAADPVPVVAAAGSRSAARRAARLGCGMVFGSHSTPEEARSFVDVYREAGGEGPVLLGRRVWIGPSAPGSLDRQFAMYQRLGRGSAPWDAETQARQVLTGAGDDVAAALVDQLAATGATGVSLRVHRPECEPADVADQLRALADAVLPAMRAVHA